MVWGFNMSIVRRPRSQSVTIISEPIKCISFKFQFYVTLFGVYVPLNCDIIIIALRLNQGGNEDF